jgi:Holliday junction DNA helicase RuvA
LIAQIHGLIRAVGEGSVRLAIEPFEVEIWMPELALRSLRDRVGHDVTLQTSLQLDGNQATGRLVPRLLGFLSPIDREFFEALCSVDGLGTRKALRAMVRPVREIAAAIQDQDSALLAGLPGIGEALAERIVAKLRRKVGKFALAVLGEHEHGEADGGTVAESNDAVVLRETFETLLSVGHSESQARQLIERATSGRKRYKTVVDLIEAIYQRTRPDGGGVGATSGSVGGGE